MKTIMYGAAALVVLGMATAPVLAQTQSTTSTTYIQTSKLIGSKVKASQGEEVGEIKDVVLDNNGCMAYTVVSTGGTGTRTVSGGKTVAVPWSVYSMTSDPRVLTLRVERDRIYNAPVFEYSRINEYSTSGYINNVYSYYGVSAGAGVGVGATTGVSGTTTTTGTTSTGAASTTATAPPAATASPMTSPTAGASPTATAAASPSATASATATASPTKKATRGESPSSRTRPTAPPSSRRQTESATEERAGESKEESTGTSSSPTKKSRRHSTDEGSTTESTVSPKATPEQE
jgi:sporulation protein YlmC with PRC-barrel domain